MIEWCSEKWLFNQLSSGQTIYCQILWWETERENCSWSLLGVKGFFISFLTLACLPLAYPTLFVLPIDCAWTDWVARTWGSQVPPAADRSNDNVKTAATWPIPSLGEHVGEVLLWSKRGVCDVDQRQASPFCLWLVMSSTVGRNRNSHHLLVFEWVQLCQTANRHSKSTIKKRKPTNLVSAMFDNHTILLFWL